MKFRVIQSNNRGLISKVGDKTFFSKKPKIGEEFKEMATLFIWVKKPNRFVSRAWTVWTGEKIHKDFIYEVTKFRDIIMPGEDKRKISSPADVANKIVKYILSSNETGKIIEIN